MRTLAPVLSALALVGCHGLGGPETEPVLRLPPRPADATTGSEISRRVDKLPASERERVIEDEIIAGNVPTFLRQLAPITVAATIDGQVRELTYFVTPDYLAVGSDDDFLRVPLTARTAQRIADRLECMLPTRKMVDQIYLAAAVVLAPRPFSPERFDIASAAVFDASHRAIEANRAGRSGLIAGIKKDIVISPRVGEHPGRVVIYGWHRRDGTPIQPLSWVHSNAHVDYSHGIRLVRRTALLDGAERALPDLLADPVVAPLISDEGPFHSWRYDPTHE